MGLFPTDESSCTDKIDDSVTDGLSGTEDSLAYRVEEIEKHLHNSEKIYGNASNAMLADEPVAFRVTSGVGAWGTELLLTDGTVIESGSATKKFDPNRLYITAVQTADVITIFEIRYGSKGTPLTAVATTDSGNLFTKTDHGLANTNTVILSTIASTTGINAYTVYYVVGVSGANFQLSLTSGGAAVTLTTDGTCTVTPVTLTDMTKTVVSKATTKADADPITLIAHRVTCDQVMTARTKAPSAKTLDFLIGLHTYEA